MDGLATLLADQFSVLAMPEVVAVLFAMLYLVFAIRQNIWCWFCAGISTAIFIYVYFAANLYMESFLNAFYFAMAIYGWNQWQSGKTGENDLAITIWPQFTHLLAVVSIMAISLVSGFLLATYTDAAFPYVDSATTFAAIWATFLVAKKVLENWWYWLLIDLVSVFIYWSRGLELTAVLFAFYVVLIPIGLISWRRSYQIERGAASVPA